MYPHSNSQSDSYGGVNTYGALPGTEERAQGNMEQQIP